MKKSQIVEGILIFIMAILFISWMTSVYIYVTPKDNYYLKTHGLWYKLESPEPVNSLEFFKPYMEEDK